MAAYLWIAFGSALGGMGRYWTGLVMIRLWPVPFPWGTLLINMLGSFVIGLFAALTDAHGRYPLGVTPRLFVMVGICGGYTTFSSFSLQTLGLMQDNRLLEAGLNVLGSVALCLIAVWLGMLLGMVGQR